MSSMGKKCLLSYRLGLNSQMKNKIEQILDKNFTMINSLEMIDPLDSENRDCNMVIASDSKNLMAVYSIHLGYFAVAIDGKFINQTSLINDMLNKNQIVRSMASEEVLMNLILQYGSNNTSWPGIIKHILTTQPGGYSFIIMTKSRIYGARDCYGVKSLVLGNLNDVNSVVEYDVIGGKPVVKPRSPSVLASDSLLLNKINANYIRQVLPGKRNDLVLLIIALNLGEIVELSDNGLKSLGMCYRTTGDATSLCSMEYVSLSTPAMILEEQRVQNIHYKLGQSLASDTSNAVDYLCSIPNISQSFIYGFAEVSKLPITEAFYHVSSPIEGSILNVYTENVINKKISLVVDSPLNCDLKMAIFLLKKSSVKEIHLRFCCPPIVTNCPFGIDIKPNEITFNDITSVRYVTLEMLSNIISKNIEDREVRNIGHCFHCFGKSHTMLKFA